MPKSWASFTVLLLLAASGNGCTGTPAPLVVFLGDSLTDGWGVSRNDAYPAVLARELAVRNRAIRAVNAGRSGDTVSQGRARLASVLKLRPDVLVVALGINDALRGMRADEAEQELRLIVTDARAGGTRVILVGVHAPGALATAHTHRFELMYERLADEQRVLFVPDLLAGAAGNPARMFPDALHPNAAGQRQLADNVRPALELLVTEIADARKENKSAGNSR